MRNTAHLLCNAAYFGKPVASGIVSECSIGFTEIDTDRDGVIELEEFLEWWGAP